MTLKEATNSCFRNYVMFKGRATRSEFWKFLLFILLVSIALLILNSVIMGPDITYQGTFNAAGEFVPSGHVRYSFNTGSFGNIFGLVVLLPWLAVSWQRMHDINKPGWLMFVPWLALFGIMFLAAVFYAGPSRTIGAFTGQGPVSVTFDSPFPALIVFASFLWAIIQNLIWLCRRSDPNENQYGPNLTEVPS